MVSIDGKNKADVLAALYNRAKPQGMGFLHYDPTPMTREVAEEFLSAPNESLYFDYLKGRVMKVDLRSDTEFSERLYDRDNGQGAAQAAIDSI